MKMKTSLGGLAVAALVVFATVVGATSCGTRSVIGNQEGGRGGNPGTAGTLAGHGGIGENVSGTAGTLWMPAGDTGSTSRGGVFGSAGAAGDQGNPGTAGAAGTLTGSECPSSPGGAAGASAPLLPGVEHATNRYGSFVAVGDLNGDGKPDLVATNDFLVDQTGITAAAGRPAGDSGSVSVFMSQSSGGFAAPQHYDALSIPTSLAVGDLDGDGKADVAYTNNRGVAVMLSDGTGVLTAPVMYGTGIEPRWVAMGDLNGDGRRDLAVANRGSATADIDGDVTVLLNIGRNPMFAAANYPAGRYPVHVAIADLSGDGQPELTVSSYNGVVVLNQNSPGTFAAPRGSLGGVASASSAAIGDVNGDARPDLIVWGVSGGVGVLLNVGSGLFGAATIYNFPANAPVAIGDLTGDGKPDLIGSGYVSASCSGVTFAPNRGDGTFGASVLIAVNPPTTGPVAVGDLNADGKLDVAVPNVDGVAVLLNAVQ
jgi:hypothetical protein